MGKMSIDENLSLNKRGYDTTEIQMMKIIGVIDRAISKDDYGSKVDLQASSVCAEQRSWSQCVQRKGWQAGGSAGWSHELAISSSKQYALMATCWPSLASFGPTHPHSLVVH